MITIPAAYPPFSLSAVAESHGWVQLPPFTWHAETGVLTRVQRLDSGRVVELSLREEGDGVRVMASGGLAQAEAREIVKTVRWMLQLEHDLSGFFELARCCARLAHVEPAAKGRILRSPTVFEDVVKTILTTNVQWSGTIRMVEGLVTAFGARLHAQAGAPSPLRSGLPHWMRRHSARPGSGTGRRTCWNSPVLWRQERLTWRP